MFPWPHPAPARLCLPSVARVRVGGAAVVESSISARLTSDHVTRTSLFSEPASNCPPYQLPINASGCTSYSQMATAILIRVWQRGPQLQLHSRSHSLTDPVHLCLMRAPSSSARDPGRTPVLSHRSVRLNDGNLIRTLLGQCGNGCQWVYENRMTWDGD